MKAFFARRPSLVILLGAIAIAIVMVATRERTPPLERPERAWVVDVAPAKTQTLRPTLELFGSVQSPQDAELSAGVDGLITDVKVLDGETVAEGETLLLIDDRDVQLALQQAEADLLEVEAKRKFAKLRLERGRQALEKETELLALTEKRAKRAAELSEQGLLSQADLDTTDENLKRQQLAVNQSQLNVEEVEIQLSELAAQRSRARAQRDQAKLDLERARVTAPFDGVVSELAKSRGDRVRADDTLMRLQNPAAIEVRTQIPARYAADVTGGIESGEPMQALVQLGEQSVTGKLARISGQTREASGGVDSFVRFDSPPIGLRLGSTVRVLLYLPPQPNVIALPAESLYGRDRLYKLVDDRMQMVEVERVGERVHPVSGTEVLIRSDQLTNSDWIVTTKLSNAADGLLTQSTATPGRIDAPPPEAAAQDTR